MENDRLLVLYPQKRGSEKERARLDEVLEAALDGIDAEIVENMDLLEQDPERYRGRRLLFAVPLGKNGINAVTMKSSPGCAAVNRSFSVLSAA